MKKNLLSFICFFASLFSTQAQSLYGLTGGGGDEGGGALIKFIPSTNNLSVATSFENPAYAPQSGLIQANDGKLYGTTSGGGSSYNGVIFSYNPSTSTYTKLKNFSGADGAHPSGSLVQADNGKLYGTTSGGGSSGNGVIFSFDPSSSTYTKLIDFVSVDGAGPTGGLVQASDGKLYGMTSYGGSNSYGVIFSFDPSSSTYTKLMDFGGSNGARPYGSLLQANDGKLYGMTSIGGKYMYYTKGHVGHGHGGYYRSDNNNNYRSDNDGYGVIFSFNPKTTAYKKLLDFDLTSGAGPYGSLMQASNGKLYGTTSGGGTSGSGVLFSYDPSSNTQYINLQNFDGANGAYPRGKLMQASNGTLFGTTYGGGSGYNGVIFSFDPNSTAYNKLVEFDGTNGANPSEGLMQANNGKLYGVTSGGGVWGYSGVIFSYDPNSPAYEKLVVLGNTNGTSPSGSLVQASNGKLYGTTSGGGSIGGGVIFSYDPSTSTYTKLKDFDDANGNNRYGGFSLIDASNGKLYGITSSGGSSDYGVVFSFDPSTSTYTKLIDFVGANGQQPSGSLVHANDGKLYGTTLVGGSSNSGVIFSYDPSTSAFTYTSLNDFINGIGPAGGLVQANNGKLYGTTAWGGSNNRGVMFSFDPSTSTYTKLKDFGYNDYPLTGGMMQASNGKLYGLMTGGGYGSIFSFDPSSSTFTKLKFFGYNDVNGSIPYGSLVQASDGNLYGMTYGGGNNNLGVIFSFDPSTSDYTKLQDYNGTNGANPGYGSAFIELNSGVLPTTRAIFSPKNVGNNEHDAIELKIAPNPVFSSASILFKLPQSQHISLKIFDASGKMIKFLADKEFEQGQYTFQWNTAEVSAGIYFLHFVTDAFSETKKLLVIK